MGICGCVFEHVEHKVTVSFQIEFPQAVENANLKTGWEERGKGVNARQRENDFIERI